MSGSSMETPPSAQANFFQFGSQPMSSRFGGGGGAGSSTAPPWNPPQERAQGGQSRDGPEPASEGEVGHSRSSVDAAGQQLFHDTTHVLLPPIDGEVAETPRSAARRQWEVAIGAEGTSEDEDVEDEDDDEAQELAQLLASSTSLSMAASLPGAASGGRRGVWSEGRGDYGRDPCQAYQAAVCELVRTSSEFNAFHEATQLKLSSEQRARTRLESELSACTAELAELRARCADTSAAAGGQGAGGAGETALKAALACDVEVLSRQSPDVLAALQASLTSARDAVSDALLAARVAERLQLADSCAICMERPLDTALLQCGHRVCGTCAARLSLCHVCRAPVTARVRVY
jgi:hypothetical protein